MSDNPADLHNAVVTTVQSTTYTWPYSAHADGAAWPDLIHDHAWGL